ncbi:hypothetical protein HDU67_004756 [Dinochytrium kinnereticum]|nr:hypothetical protein HDU67_004756 [Dinochytrium kinnereticum]
MNSLQDRILHTIAHQHHHAEGDAMIGDDLTSADDLEMSGDDHLLEEDMDETEEMVEEIPEQELLAEMDRMEDSLTIARMLFNSTELKIQDGSWRDVRVVPRFNEILIPGPMEASEPFSSMEFRVLPQTALEALWRQGFTFVDGLLDATIVNDARNRAVQMANEGLLIPACQVRMEDDPFRDRKARDDVIAWLHPQDPLHPALATVVELMKTVQADLKQVMWLQGEAEYQLALYRGDGGGYERHRDAFPNDQPSDTEQRRVTAILYLTSPSPSAMEFDGSLKVYRPLDHPSGIEINAVPGRLVLFLSGVVDHQVMPVFGEERVAVTAWMR